MPSFNAINLDMSKFIKEFKEFAVKGNAIDMAVGVIIGAAFGKIVSSIVSDIIMPPIGWLIGGMDFTDLKVKLPVNPINPEVSATINYGVFVQTVIEFVIIAFCVFLLVKGINIMARKKKTKLRLLLLLRLKRNYCLPKFETY